MADRLLVLELKVAEEAGPELRSQVLVLDELRRRAHVVEGCNLMQRHTAAQRHTNLCIFATCVPVYSRVLVNLSAYVSL